MNWSNIRAKGAMRGVLSIALLIAFMLALFRLIETSVAADNVQLITYMLGQLSVFTGGALAYYFATSKSSNDKNEMIEDMKLDHSKHSASHTFDEPTPLAQPSGDTFEPRKEMIE